MSSVTQDIVFGVTGQALFFDAPEGRPQSATSIVIYENSLGEHAANAELAAGIPSIEADPNTTFDASSGVSQPDPRRCNLTATTGVAVGRAYLATNAEGESEFVEVGAVSAADHVLARTALENDYAPGALFQSTRLTAAIDAAWAADVTNLSWEFSPNPKYRARWQYVGADGAGRVVDTYFDLLRYAARYSITGVDVNNMRAGWLERLPRDDRERQGRATIEEAYHQVKWDLYADLVPDQAIRNRELFERLIGAKAVQLVYGDEASQERYSALYKQLIRSGTAPVAVDEQAAAQPVPRRPLWRR